MGGKLGFDRLWRWAWPARDPGDIDAADVGTAFGMELSIEAQTHPTPAVQAPQAPIRGLGTAPPRDDDPGVN